MELFRNANFDWMGKRRIFIAISLAMVAISLLSIYFRGVLLGVDFRGGTLVYVKFTHQPQEDKIRAAVQSAGISGAQIQRYGAPANNEVIVALDQQATDEEALGAGKDRIVRALQGDAPQGKLDLNNTGSTTLRNYLTERDPLRAGTDADERYRQVVERIAALRIERGGVLASFDELKGVVEPAVLQALLEGFYVSDFAVRNVEIVGPQVGAQLRQQAARAVLFSAMGMLVYLWFRFELMYGVASVVAVLHDALITVGAFSLLQKEVSLVVIAALLTLIGYSMNDTIVIFDRIRENLKMMRRERLQEIINRSINQTLARTVLTSGLTFLTVLALWLFGGEVLNGFAFALVIGIIVGTFSSVGVAAPLVLAWNDRRSARDRRGTAAVTTEPRREKVRA